MKKLPYFLIGCLFGFIAHKAINYYYDYSFNEAFDSTPCAPIMLKGGNLTDRFNCTYKQMGWVEKLKYILIRPNAKNGVGIDHDDWTM